MKEMLIIIPILKKMLIIILLYLRKYNFKPKRQNISFMFHHNSFQSSNSVLFI